MHGFAHMVDFINRFAQQHTKYQSEFTVLTQYLKIT